MTDGKSPPEEPKTSQEDPKSSQDESKSSQEEPLSAAEPTLMIEADGLTKCYGAFSAVKDVTFSVPQGQVAAFLGPNGAGKSTTMKLLTGYLSPTSGRGRIGGFDVSDQRLEACRLVGYLPENGPLHAEMTPVGMLKYLGLARGLTRSQLSERLDYVVEQCALHDVWRKAIGNLSRGYRQRVSMAQALLHDPQVLIMDEPTSGLDPNQVHDIRELIHDLSATKTILLSTHILREVQATCDRVILIHEGQIVFDGPVGEMGDGDDMEDRFRQLTSRAG